MKNWMENIYSREMESFKLVPKSLQSNGWLQFYINFYLFKISYGSLGITYCIPQLGHLLLPVINLWTTK